MSFLNSHLVALTLFSALASTVMGTLAEDTFEARRLYALKAFGGFFLTSLAGAWLMRLLS